jgi:hypothetical protein
MSTYNNRTNNSNQSVTDFSTEKMFIFNNQYRGGETYTNATGSEVTLAVGTLMGRIEASGKLLPLASGASDGSQIPVGILAEAVTVADTESATVTICIAGEVDGDMLVLDGSDTLDTMIDGRSIRDRINGDTVGIQVIEGTELTGYDN